MQDEIFDYCLSRYNSIYIATKQRLEEEVRNSSRNHTVSASKAKEIETASQLQAIKETMKEGRLLYPTNIPTLWANIYKAHLYRKSGISDPEIVSSVIAADQSWKASSGHAFEYMAKEIANLALANTNLRFLLQRDLNDLIREGKLSNEVRDISWLKEQVDTDNYDLFAVGQVGEDIYCFGCIQCKTSIRDRVSRDRELSATAMKAFFWSISLVIDGTQLTTPKYVNMVNGGTTTFEKNGWHGMYDMSHTIPGGRIYDLDMDFEIIRSHAIQAFDAWRTQRQWFTNEWKALDMPINHIHYYPQIEEEDGDYLMAAEDIPDPYQE